MQLVVASRTGLTALANFLAVLTLCGAWPDSAAGQPPPSGSQGEKPLVEVVRVDGTPIYQGEVDQALAKFLRNKNLATDDRARLAAHFLDQLINRRLVIKYLKGRDQSLSPQLVDAEIKAQKGRLEQQKISFDDHLRDAGITEPALRADIEWRMSWKQYIDRRITDKVLEQHFDHHQRQFDGTQLRVRHILWKGEAVAGKAPGTPDVTLAQQIRHDILQGKTTFEAAVAKYSTGPSATIGGDVGFISRHGEMVEPFAAAAFELKVNEISPPVVTRFGVHLIQCVEIKPGTKKWGDVADLLRRAVIQQGFQKIVAGERSQATIEFTGQGAYLDPKSGELVMPKHETARGGK